jgi:hypothetical protein
MANTKVTGDLIASSTIATGNIADNAVTSDKISGITTAHITEGSNLYYTDARARGAVSVSGNALSYNSSTGVITSNFEESPTFTGNVNTGRLFVEQSGADMIDMARTGVGTYRLAISGSDAFSVFDVGANADRLIINSSGQVGIGTTSPSNSLHILGTSDQQLKIDVTSGGTFSSINFAEAGSNKAAIAYKHSTNEIQLPYSGNASSFVTMMAGGSERIRIQSDGKVGIGTDDPVGKTDIFVGASGYTNNITTLPVGTWSFANGSGSNSYPSLVSKSNATGAGMTLVAATDDGAPNGMDFNIRKGDNTDFSTLTTSGFTFSRFGTTLTTILRNGNVGIGTTSPGTKLELYDNTSSGGYGVYPALTIKNDNASGFSAVHFNQSTNQKARIEVSNSAGSMGLYTTSAANGIIINSSGNVGIGLTDPEDRLQIDHPGNPTAIRIGDNTTDDCYVIFNTDGNDWSIGTDRSDSNKFKISDYSRVGTNDRLVIDTSGNIMMGKTSQSGNAALTIKSTAGGNTGIILIEGDTANNGWGMYARTVDDYRITRFTNGSYSDKLIIESDGRVGIGVAPTEMLHINGGGSGPEVRLQGTWGSHYIRAYNDNWNFLVGGTVQAINIKNNGNVQMGTTNNGSKLNVGGTIAATTNNGASGMVVPRSYGIDWGGSTFTHTFDPVALFGMGFRGGQVLFECTGWQMAMNNGYIMWRNAGGSDPIGTNGAVSYVQTAYSNGGQSGSNTIAVSTNSGTNNITITFTGWHGNSHGFACRLTTNYS